MLKAYFLFKLDTVSFVHSWLKDSCQDCDRINESILLIFIMKCETAPNMPYAVYLLGSRKSYIIKLLPNIRKLYKKARVIPTSNSMQVVKKSLIILNYTAVR